LTGKKKKASKKNVLHKTPRIEFITLSGNQFDFFPHLKETGDANQKKIIADLKYGRYQPFMQGIPYKAEINPKNQYLKKAEPMSDMYEASMQDKFDYSAAIYQKEPSQTWSQTETVIKQFAKTNIPIMPRYYHNPLQYFDHVLLADGYVNSFGGTIVDAYVDFVMPKTLYPVLKLRNPDKAGTPEQQQDLLDKNQFIIEALKEVDNFYSDEGPEQLSPYLGTPLQKKFRALITNCFVFGRNALVFESWKDHPKFKLNGKEYPEIPTVIKWVQSIDMGMIQYDLYSGKVGGIYMYNAVPFIAAENMIYLVNKPYNPMIGSNMYGFSLMQRAIDPIRTYRRILAENFAQFIRTSYAGMGYFIMNTTGYDEETRLSIRQKIISSYKAGEIGLIDVANVADFEFKEMKVTPEIGALMELQKAMVNTTVGIMGMPQSLIFDESAATRSTMVGRVVSFINNQITQLRTSIGQQIAAQWYIRNFRILFKDKKELLEMFTIGVEFEEMDLETKLEKAQRLLTEMQLNPYNDEWIGKELGDPEYLHHIDTDKRDKENEIKSQNPLANLGKKPPGVKTYSVTDADTGKVNQVSPV
jgi:hypothetical protein